MVWIMVDRTAPALFMDPSTLRTGNGVLSCQSMSLCLLAKLELMIIPSAPLSTSACALISLPECFPMRDTRSMREGLLIFLMVPLGTGSESTVSNNTRLWTSNLDTRGVSIDSAAIEPFKNPQWDLQGCWELQSDSADLGRARLQSWSLFFLLSWQEGEERLLQYLWCGF
jgi:hypothetical protein